jgi:hypothetical protein
MPQVSNNLSSLAMKERVPAIQDSEAVRAMFRPKGPTAKASKEKRPEGWKRNDLMLVTFDNLMAMTAKLRR